jgi:hypothetical protein
MMQRGSQVTDVNLQSTSHSTKQHIQNANVSGARVEQRYTVEEHCESQAKLCIVPYRGAAFPANAVS